MGFLSSIWEGIKTFISYAANLIRKVINGVLNFLKNIVAYFKNMPWLQRGRHTPFIADTNNPQFKAMLKQAPVKNAGIFEAVYDEQTDEVEEGQLVEADALDTRTRETLGNEPLVVLN